MTDPFVTSLPVYRFLVVNEMGRVPGILGPFSREELFLRASSVVQQWIDAGLGYIQSCCWQGGPVLFGNYVCILEVSSSEPPSITLIGRAELQLSRVPKDWFRGSKT